MQPCLLLIPLVCAVLDSAKIIMMPVLETRQAALPPPTPVDGLRPFQFPTDYNGTNNHFDGIPERWLYCSKTPEAVNPDYLDAIANGSFVKSTVDKGMIPNNTGWVWPYPLNGPSTQVYVCNYNRLFDFPISAGVFKMTSTWLDEICGEKVAGYVYLDTPWDVAIGRNSTTPQGDADLECGGKWAE